MLYVIFTFGEMIIAIASYFSGDGSWDTSTLYFSLMAFLIVVGLFLIYGYVYDNLIDSRGKL
jgi:low temperature requirement protein LtrA